MADITRADFMEKVNEIIAEKPTYKLGRDGDNGLCDCIGLTIGAIRRAGGKWTGLHGSNYSARNEMRSLGPVSAGDLFVGMQVYKAYEPGQSGYALPDRYAGNADRRDYYHAGVVASVDPLKIRHVSGPGALTDTKLGKWRYGGRLKKVTYDGVVAPNTKEDDGKMATEFVATVVADSGGSVKMRAKASAAERLYWEVPVGSKVKVLEQFAPDGWLYCDYNGQKGYMQSQYLVSVAPDLIISTTVQPTDRMAALAAEIRAVLTKYGV